MSDSDNIMVYENFDIFTNEDRYVVFSEKSRHFIKLNFKRGKFDPEYIKSCIEQAKHQLREEDENDEDSGMGEND